ncbi:Endonuclease/exonuclease/phosphatase [Geopyxis carbonaria]|nr:Endonuclease/exonuclease/phosphatase [Geopyxis carbonaria]
MFSSRPSSSSSLDYDYDMDMALHGPRRASTISSRSSMYSDSHGLSRSSYTYNPPATPTLPFHFTGTHWSRISASAPPPALPRNKPLQFITWNLDFQAPHAATRLSAALTHLRSLITPGAPAIIHLQEVHSTALATLLAHPWVRRTFQLSDVTPLGPYFTITLISRGLRVAQVFRAPFAGSRMGRDVLLVDIDVALAGRSHSHSYSVRSSSHGSVLRVANTHLESTPEGVAQRPRQLAMVAEYLRQPGVIAGVVGGDVNALLAGEKNLPATRGISLRDAFNLNAATSSGWGALGQKSRGSYGEAQGHTWGYQSSGSRARQSATRRDKILYAGDITFGASAGKVVRRVGVGLQFCAPDGGRYGGSYKWVSDHFGLATHIIIGAHRR